MLRIVALIGLMALAACEPPPPNACQQANTYGEMFGTPENRGPCWGRVISASQMGNIRVYMVEMPLPGYAIGSMTYEGNRLIQAGVTRG